ncbi:root UVB sensitive protein [Actinidia rufa]|uniref:Root UVB sensitive protein n=1 Tax=Actinidia rufa TaxID=165716 RepID=A0A7J0F8E1_9ERIC|nr:root UVB sensitive protein [Actinidia rufa]
MAPMKLKPKPSPNSTAQTLTAADARLLARESIRISADLAASPPATVVAPESVGLRNFGFFGGAIFGFELEIDLLRRDRWTPVEVLRGKWRIQAIEEGIDPCATLMITSALVVRLGSLKDGPKGVAGGTANQAARKPSTFCLSRRWLIPGPPIPGTPNSVREVSPEEELMSFIRSYVVPEGFPNSVSPSYVPYMTWRALKQWAFSQHKTLLSSVGVSKNRATPGAVAINWILKNWQLQLCHTFFLPLACAANVAKNVGAVTSTSTRTPIYKAFAKGENIGDVTAKGECVGNIADLLGTGLGIMIAKRNPSLVTTFSLLSCGYLLSSYQEVKSVVLRTLNRARLTVAIESFLKTGRVPTLQEGNMMETITSFPWSKEMPVVLGPRFRDAFQDPNSYVAMEPIFQKERYMVTYNPSKGSIYALLKDQAKSDDILKAAFHAHVLLHIIRSSNQRQPFPRNSPENDHIMPSISDLDAHIAQSCKMVSALYGPFKSKATEQGWVMSESLLNPGRARLCDTNN